MNVACYGQDGHEKWRVVIAGRFLLGTKPGKGGRLRRVYSLRRLKVMRNGDVEVFEGHRCFPATETTDTLRLTPSRDQGELDVVRSIFSKFANEAISPTSLANYLNVLGIKHPYGDRWECHHVRSMLRNPIYIGQQRWNSHGQGRFFEFLDGNERPVQDRSGGRVRSSSDWILSEPLFEAVVPDEVWKGVQKKLSLSSPQPRSPRSPALWLRGLIVCVGCGKQMRGYDRGTRQEYFCSTYSKDKHSGCRRNSVNHDVVEACIRWHLKEVGKTIAGLVGAFQSGDSKLLEPYQSKFWEQAKQAASALERMLSDFTESEDAQRMLIELGGFERLGKFKYEPDAPLSRFQITLERSFGLFSDVHRALFSQDNGEIQQRIKQLDEEHTRLTNRFLDLDPATAKQAVEKAKARIAELEERKRREELSLSNVADEFDKNVAQMKEICLAIQEAEKVLCDERSTARRKAAAVRACIKQIDVSFRPTGKKYPTSELTRVEIVTPDGQSKECPDQAWRCRGKALLGRRSA